MVRPDPVIARDPDADSVAALSRSGGHMKYGPFWPFSSPFDAKLFSVASPLEPASSQISFAWLEELVKWSVQLSFT